MSIKSADELHATVRSEVLKAAKAVRLTIPVQRSGITWEYVLMLARIPCVKADRMVTRCAADVIGADVLPTPTEAAQLVMYVAESREWHIIHLDHAIWRFESGRPVNAEE